MKLTILGSGTMMPTKTRHPAGYLLEADDTKILLDCGHTTMARLVEMGVDLHEIDCVAITHFHTDHFSDCFPLVHARWVDDVQSNPPREHKSLTILGPREIQKRYKKWREIFWPEPKEDYPIEFFEGYGTYVIARVSEKSHDQNPNFKILMSNQIQNSNDKNIKRNFPHQAKFIITPFPIHHVPWFRSAGYKIEYNSKTFVYTGDLGSQQEQSFYGAIRNVDCLLIEAGVLTPAPNHFTAEQALELAHRYGIKKVLLTHVRDQNVSKIETIISHRNQVLNLVFDGYSIEV